ncbi:MAG: hypothetical protein HY328_09195 [Chloroflexi bacterium]|nr:hypothetical protein [Chloroflexota bacterium]
MYPWMSRQQRIFVRGRVSRGARDVKRDIIIGYAVTANAFEEEHELYRTQGFDDLLRKPYRQYEVVSLIARHLGLRFVYEESAVASTKKPERVENPGASIPSSPEKYVTQAVSLRRLRLFIPRGARRRKRNSPDFRAKMHDVRNALSVIKGYAELLAENRDSLSEQMVEDSIWEIVQQAERIEESL